MVGVALAVVGITIVFVAIWINAERRGKPWQRYVAGSIMTIWFAACTGGITYGIMYLNAYSERLQSNYQVNYASQEMLTTAIRRMEAGECEQLVGEFRWMRHEIGHPKTDAPMIVEPFMAFVDGKASDFP